jgi:hypothetical protein
MGCFSLSFYKKVLTLSWLFFLTLASTRAEIEGVNVPEKFKCADQELALSGAALRTATFFKIKIYVLALYASQRIKTGSGSELEQRPLCFVMTYLKDFDEKDVDRAWDYQFKESSEHPYPDLKNHIKELKHFFGEIKGLRKQTIELSLDSTKFYENDKLKGEIKSKDFQQSFLSIWFGKNPPTKDLKETLLQGP